MFAPRTTSLLLATGGLLAALPAAAHADPTLLSRATGIAGAPANGGTGEARYEIDTSRTGRFVVFTSNATNLVPGGLPSGSGSMQVYLRDVALGTTELVSRASGVDGAPSSGPASRPSVSDDGRFVAFEASTAANLAPTQSTDGPRVYVRDLQTGITRKMPDDVSDNVPGNASSWDPDLSGDGGTVAYTTTGFTWQLGAPTVVTAPVDGSDTLRFAVTSPAGWPSLPSRAPSISRDGSRIAYETGDGHVAVVDRPLGTQTPVDVSDAAGAPGDGAASEPAISADGSAVTFVSSATNLVAASAGAAATPQIYLRRLGGSPRTALVSAGADGTPVHAGAFPTDPSIAENGDTVAFTAFGLAPGVTNRRIYVRAMGTGAMTPVLPDPPAGSVISNSVQDADLTPSGTAIAFQSGQENLSTEDVDPAIDAFLTPVAPVTIREPEGPRIPEQRPRVIPPLKLSELAMRGIAGLPSQRRACRTTQLSITFDAQAAAGIQQATVTIRWGKRGTRVITLAGADAKGRVRLGRRPSRAFTVSVKLDTASGAGELSRSYARCPRR